MKLRALVFDLAGVLLDFGGVESLHKLSDGRISEEEFFRFWSEATCAHDLHCGRCTPEHFAWQAVGQLRLPVTSERFLAEFQTWLRGPFPGALEMLEGLRPQYRVACLSNTDELHVRQFDEQLQLQNWFDECFYSNEIGLRKPDPKAYLHVSKALDVPPNEIAFFDDSLECVNGAAAVGMHAEHVVGFGDLRIRLSRMGILDRRARHPYWTPGH
jgi:HAD superfamily hydrolase (TIGR01509 family)